MAVPVYATDLTTINDGSGTFTEPTGAILGTLTNADTDNFVQATSCSSKSTGTSGAPALAGIGILAGAGQSISTPQAFYAWVFTGAGAMIDTYANGGIRLIVGSSLANYKMWSVLGKDTFPYVGWTCIAVDPSLTADYTQGTPSGTLQYFGAVFNCLINIGKGNPMALDAIRWGRVVTVTLGEAANYATFAGIATENDSINNRWGQFQAISGGYQLQGKLLLGVTGGSVVDFRDSNKNVVIAIGLKVASSFNAIEIQNAGSRVDWTSCNFSALGTVSRGTLTVTDNADVNISGCSFTGMNTFSFLSATDCLSSIFRGCNAVTAAGSNLTGSQFLVPTVAADTSAVIWDVATDPDGKLNTCVFTKGTNAHHAIEFGTSSPLTMTLRGLTFSGFNGANANNDSVLHIKRTTGTVTIYTVGCVGTVSYKTAGAAVVLVADPVTAAINVKNTTGSNIQNARVLLKAAAGGPFPSDVTVTIVNSGATATVTHTTHAMTTNDKVVIKGASLQANNGVYSIIYITDNSYSYTMGSSPGSSPTGTIKATYVLIEGLTDVNGNISMSRVFPSSQPVTGWVRFGSSPYYKPAALGGTVSSSLGYSTNALLVPDV